MCYVVLVAGDGAVECLSVGEAAEMEALAPSVLVEVGSKVVIPIVTSLVILLSLSFVYVASKC